MSASLAWPPCRRLTGLIRRPFSGSSHWATFCGGAASMAETNQWRWFDSASRARPRLHSSCDSLRPPASAGEKRRWKRGRADGFLKRFENRIKNTSADVTSRSFQLCANLSRHPSLCHGCMTNQLSFVGEEAGGTMGAKSVETHRAPY